MKLQNETICIKNIPCIILHAYKLCKRDEYLIRNFVAYEILYGTSKGIVLTDHVDPEKYDENGNLLFCHLAIGYDIQIYEKVNIIEKVY